MILRVKMVAGLEGSGAAKFESLSSSIIHQSPGSDGREHVILAYVHGGASAVFLGWRELAERHIGAVIGYGGVHEQLVAWQR